MKNLEKTDKKNLQAIINDLKDNNFGIPNFQREFEWQPWDVTELLKSIFEDYYVGTLLFWKGSKENNELLSCQPIYGLKQKENNDYEYIVLDGQQRLSALYYAFFSPDKKFPKRKSRYYYFIEIEQLLNENYDEAIYYEISSKNADMITDDREEQYKQNVFPLWLFSKGTFEIYSWLEGYETYSNNNGGGFTKEKKEKFIEIIQGLLEQYQVSYIELDKKIPIEKVCDIFQKINSTGLDLNIFDLMNALLTPKGIFLKKSWEDAVSKFDEKIPNSDKAKIYTLQVISIIKQNYCAPKFLYHLIPGAVKQERTADGKIKTNTLINNKEEFNENWLNAIEAMEKSLKIVNNPRDLGAIDANFLPYPTMLPILTALNVIKSDIIYKDRAGVENKIRQWYWSSIITKNYSSSVESQMAKDFVSMKRWFINDEEIPDVVQEARNIYQTLNLEDEKSSNSAIYKSIFCILVKNGAKDFTTFEDPSYSSLEDHHIVPRSWGIKNGISKINSILNRTPISDITNKKVIRDKLPNEYFKTIFNNQNSKDAEEMFESHFINNEILEILQKNDFNAEDFAKYITIREKLIIDYIGKLINN